MKFEPVSNFPIVSLRYDMLTGTVLLRNGAKLWEKSLAIKGWLGSGGSSQVKVRFRSGLGPGEVRPRSDRSHVRSDKVRDR